MLPDCAAMSLNGQRPCGAWGQATSTWLTTPLRREHFLFLPQGYDFSRPYGLVLQGPGCGGAGQNVYDFEANADGAVIRVGVSPPDSIVGHGTAPGQGCFDDREGDDSVDWVHYEALYDKLNEELCFDRNRVFVSGNSSGAWWANELGCKYAGDATRPVRGVISNEGGLPTDPRHKPTCSTKPISGLWVSEEPLGEGSTFPAVKYALSRAMAVNGCAPSTDYDSAKRVDYPIPGRPAGECQRMADCPPLHPLIVCRLSARDGTPSHDEVVNPTASHFLQSFR